MKTANKTNSIENLEFAINSIIDSGLINTIISKDFSETVKSLDNSNLIDLDKIIKKILTNRVNDIKISLVNGGGLIGLSNEELLKQKRVQDISSTLDNATESTKGQKVTKEDSEEEEKLNRFGILFDQIVSTFPANKSKSKKLEDFDGDILTKIMAIGKNGLVKLVDPADKAELKKLEDSICDSCQSKDTCTSVNKTVSKEEEKAAEDTTPANEDKTTDDVKIIKTEYFVIPVNEIKNFKKLQKAINVLKLQLNPKDIYKVEDGVFYFNSPQGKNSFDTKRISFDN